MAQSNPLGLGKPSASASQTKLAVLIPCLNEEVSIGKVVRDFREQLPESTIFVYDNGSQDRTCEVAREAGARVRLERRKGKGYVVQAMFREIDADYYILVDGDDTYPAERVASLLEPLMEGRADMVVGTRISRGSKSQFRFVNWLGNELFRAVTNGLFGASLTDVLSGYRAMNRTLVKSLPLFERGFGIEAELTIKALERGFRLAETPVDLRARKEGSSSKIRVLRDGLTILGTIGALFRDYKPLTFFGGLGLVILVLVATLAGTSALASASDDPARLYGLVLVFQGLGLVGVLLIAVGLVLHTVNRRFQEMEHFMRLSEDEEAGQT